MATVCAIICAYACCVFIHVVGVSRARICTAECSACTEVTDGQWTDGQHHNLVPSFLEHRSEDLISKNGPQRGASGVQLPAQGPRASSKGLVYAQSELAQPGA